MMKALDRAGPAKPRRRRVIAALAAIAAAPSWPRHARGEDRVPIARAIPVSGETLPVIGVGSWITFNVHPDPVEEAPLIPVLRTFFERGGAMIDSSPMYGSSEAVIGGLLRETPRHERLFAATKIWTIGQALGRWQLEQSRKYWGVAKFDLVHIHNMLDWQTHLETLKEMKAAGRLRYIGITTSHGLRHPEMEQALTRERFDFVQFTYNFADRSVEQRLLPLAAERKIAVVINRPFDGGRLFPAVRGKRLPSWVSEFDCDNWAQFFLKFIVSHPAVTCAIPATSQTAHMIENMGALYGRLPDAEMRKRMAAYIEIA
jgi:diketogulonate reductase-like aldo/keto reductase